MHQGSQVEVLRLKDTGALAEEGARRFAEFAREAIAQHGRFAVALAGGTTPRATYERLVQPPLRDAIDWQRTHIFWSDERYVPPDDQESCFFMARNTLLAHMHIPAANIYPMPTIGGTPEAAATAYAETLTAFFGTRIPRFDLILLGIGPDGHTASLFPGRPEVVSPRDDLVIAVHDAPKPPPTRLSFTFTTLNAAANIMFLVAGADKAGVLHEILRGPVDRARLPAQGVQPTAGKVVWLVDDQAAARL